MPTPGATNTVVESATADPASEVSAPDEPVPPLQIDQIDLALSIEVRSLPRFDRPLDVSVRQATLLNSPPWVRSLGKLGMEVTTQGWKFPTPPDQIAAVAKPRLAQLEPDTLPQQPPASAGKLGRTRLRPPQETVQFKDRLLYLLQPPLEDLFASKQVSLPFQPYPYQLKGIAFLMPRHAALLADEMGLGKTAQAIVALRLLFHAGLIRRALVVCPKPLVINWTRELRTWARGPAVRGHRRRHARRAEPPGSSPTARSSWSTTSC